MLKNASVAGTLAFSLLVLIVATPSFAYWLVGVRPDYTRDIVVIAAVVTVALIMALVTLVTLKAGYETAAEELQDYD